MKEVLLIAIGSAIVNNVVLSQFLGLCPFFGVSKKVNTAAGMGAAVIFVITIASFITSVLDKFILQQFDITYLRTIVFILVIAALVQFVEMFMKKSMAAIVQRTWYFLTTDHNKLCRSWCCPEQCTVWLWYWRKYNQWFRNSSWIYHFNCHYGRYS